MIATATRRHANTTGSSHLTHGADDYDHKARNTTRRRLDTAIITEQLETPVEIPTPKTGPVTFRVVITTQFMEWYGDENGNGRWKYKGGNEYHVRTGLTTQEVAKLGQTGIQTIADQGFAKVERPRPTNPSPHQSYEYALSWGLYASNDETGEERELAEMLEWGMITDEVHKSRTERLHTPLLS